jgi:hypothetical protein
MLMGRGRMWGVRAWIAAQVVTILMATTGPIVLATPTMADRMVGQIGRTVTDLLGGK